MCVSVQCFAMECILGKGFGELSSVGYHAFTPSQEDHTTYVPGRCKGLSSQALHVASLGELLATHHLV